MKIFCSYYKPVSFTFIGWTVFLIYVIVIYFTWSSVTIFIFAIFYYTGFMTTFLWWIFTDQVIWGSYIKEPTTFLIRNTSENKSNFCFNLSSNSEQKKVLVNQLNYYHCFMAELTVFSLELDWKKCGNFKNKDKSSIPVVRQINWWQNLYILPETFIFVGRTELLFLIIIICFAVWSLICCFQNRFMTAGLFGIQTDQVILSSYI